MDSSGYVLLLIVAACVIALIYIARKQKTLDEDVVLKAPDSSSPSGTASSTSEAEKLSGPPQNTIYAFSARSAKHLCPFCDGENSVGAKVCTICGRDI